MAYLGATAIKRDDAAMRKWFAEVSAAAKVFESRWTWLTLCRHDAPLAQRLREQRDLFDAAMVTGTSNEIETQGAAMCRGYAAACGALERVEAPDDAYQIGRDPATGVGVAIGVQRAAADRVLEVYGPGVIWITPDEVATMIAASADAVHFVTAVKRLFPGAVVS